MHELFKSYPSVDTFYFTEDGQAFENKHHAEAHAKGGKITVAVREEKAIGKEGEGKEAIGNEATGNEAKGKGKKK